MILIIIIIILMIPRYNQDVNRTKNDQGQRFPHPKIPSHVDELELPFPGIWSLMSIIPNGRCGRQYALNTSFIASIYDCYTYKPAQISYAKYNLT